MSTSNKSSRVLVMGNAVRAFLQVIRSLGKAGIEVHATRIIADPAIRSKYVTKAIELPPYQPNNPTDWLASIKSALHKYQYDLVIPTNDSNILPLYLHRDELEPLAKLYLVPEEAHNICSNKYESQELAASVGIKVPKTKVIPLSQLRAIASEWGLPLILKPFHSLDYSKGNNKKTVKLLHAENDLEQYLSICTDPDQQIIVQEFCQGRGVGIDLLAGDGNVLSAYAHRRIHEPIHGGASTCARSMEMPEDLFQKVKKLVEQVNYTGVMMAEFKWNTKTDEYYFMEINDRFWGSLNVGCKSGADYPLWLYEYLCKGRTVFPTKYKIGISSRNLYPDILWFYKNLRASGSDPTVIKTPIIQACLEPLRFLTGKEHIDAFRFCDQAPFWADTRIQINRIKHVFRNYRFPQLRRKQLITSMQKAKRILVFCAGNICRSPLAETVLKNIWGSEKEIRSGGYFQAEGRRSPDAAQAAAQQLGISLSEHRSHMLMDEDIKWADIILGFDELNLHYLVTTWPEAKSKCFLWGAMLPRKRAIIADPYSGSVEHFLKTYNTIIEAGLLIQKRSQIQ